MGFAVTWPVVNLRARILHGAPRAGRPAAAPFEGIGLTERTDAHRPANRRRRRSTFLITVLCLATSAALIAPLSAGAAVFPVRYSADSRSLVDSTGAPFPILGRTAWFVLSLSPTDYRSFLDDTASRGYTAVELHVLNH